MSIPHWISTELSKHFEGLDLALGVDFDGNGVIDGSERTDLDSDGEVCTDEWKKFCEGNENALKILGGHFKYYYEVGSAFSPDNPIHDVIAIESELVTPDEIRKAYETAEKIYKDVKLLASVGYFSLSWSPISSYPATLATHEGLYLLNKTYAAMNKNGLDFTVGLNRLFISGISEGGVDCDTSSMIALAVGHEMDWPVYMVRAPRHAFIRWDDGEDQPFNMDYGEVYYDDGIIFSDDLYTSLLNISQHSIDNGVYLHNMSYDETIALWYAIRADRKSDLGEYAEAIADYDRAIGLDPNSANAYFGRAYVKFSLGEDMAAIADYEKAVELDPNDASAHYNCANAKHALGKYAEAIDDYGKAIDLNPNYVKAYYSRAEAKYSLGKYAEAIDDYDEAIKLNPPYLATLYLNRGDAKFLSGKYKEAKEDFEKALELDPKLKQAKKKIKLAKKEMG